VPEPVRIDVRATRRGSSNALAPGESVEVVLSLVTPGLSLENIERLTAAATDAAGQWAAALYDQTVPDRLVQMKVTDVATIALDMVGLQPTDAPALRRLVEGQRTWAEQDVRTGDVVDDDVVDLPTREMEVLPEDVTTDGT
jgi:hypothetical protein